MITLTHDTDLGTRIREVLSRLHEETGGEIRADAESLQVCMKALGEFFRLVPADCVIEMPDVPAAMCRALTDLSARLGVPRTFAAVALHTGVYL